MRDEYTRDEPEAAFNQGRLERVREEIQKLNFAMRDESERHAEEMRKLSRARSRLLKQAYDLEQQLRRANGS